MLSHAKENESLPGKLLLSTALVAVTVGFGWWQYGQADAQRAAMMAQMQAQMMAASEPVAKAAPVAAAPVAAAAPDTSANAAVAADAAPAANAAPSNQMAMASPQAATPAPAKPLTQNNGPTALLPSDPVKPNAPPPLTGMAAIQNYLPTEGVSPPLPPVSGTPPADANPVLAPGVHLEDGDYTSDKISFEWGDLRARIVVNGGKINTVQIVSYPDHRSQSLYLIQLADPILTTEVIKNQMAKVNTVSSATNSSIAFQDAIANAMMKASR